MNISIKNRLIRPLALALAVSMAFTPGAFTPVVTAQSYGSGQEQAVFTQQELDQMLAPIALYPDSLLSQILMAATYPLEVVQAARWSRANPHLRDDDAVRAVESRDWDPSVKSLVAFPQILDMMDQKLDWTERLGDAFLAQQSQVMDAVQQLRYRAYAAGNLRSDDRIRVTTQDRVIVVEPAQPQVVYVPYYNPVVVYGSWWWPNYPPVYWAPWPGYYSRPGLSVGFFWGTGIALSAGFFFGGFDWHHHHARVVHVNNYYFNRPVVIDRDHGVTRVRNINAVPGEWRHDPDHRRGAPYRTTSLRQQFGRTSEADARRELRERDRSTIINNQDERRDGRPGSRDRNDNRPDVRDARSPSLRTEANTNTRSEVQQRNDNQRQAPSAISRPEPTVIVRPDGRDRGGDRPDLRDARGVRGEANGRPDVRPQENNSRPETRERNNNRSELRNSPVIRTEARTDPRPEPRASSRVEARDIRPSIESRPAVVERAVVAPTEVRSVGIRANPVPQATSDQRNRPEPRRAEDNSRQRSADRDSARRDSGNSRDVGNREQQQK